MTLIVRLPALHSIFAERGEWIDPLMLVCGLEYGALERLDREARNRGHAPEDFVQVMYELRGQQCIVDTLEDEYH